MDAPTEKPSPAALLLAAIYGAWRDDVLNEAKEKPMPRPRLLISDPLAHKPRGQPIGDFQPGDVVEGAETGRLYLVVARPGSPGVDTILLTSGPVRPVNVGGRYLAVESAELRVRRQPR